MLLPVLLTLVATGTLIYFTATDNDRGGWIAKPLASTGFVLTALAAGALDSSPGRIMMVAFCLCWLGDILLIPKDAKGAFLAGLVSFLLGHVGFIVAFVVRGVALNWAAVTAILLILPAVGVLRWLWPHVSTGMKKPVLAYIITISVMVFMAAGTHGTLSNWRIPLGATCFFLSDLSVARNRFIAPDWRTRAWGLPLYYGAQLLLAWSLVEG